MPSGTHRKAFLLPGILGSGQSQFSPENEVCELLQHPQVLHFGLWISISVVNVAGHRSAWYASILLIAAHFWPELKQPCTIVARTVPTAVTTHELSVGKLQAWLDSSGKTPRKQAVKVTLRQLLGRG